MKIAILILAHKNEVQLRKLIDTLKTDFEVFVHLDKRSAIAQHFHNEAHVHIIASPYEVSWGSREIVLAEISLLTEAYQQGCDYFMLISGQDLPIKSNAAIRQHILENPFDYIECNKLPVHYWGMSGGLDRLTLYWETLSSGPLALAKKLLGYTLRKAQKTLNIRRKMNFHPYGGSQWFNLTRRSVSYILSFLNGNIWFIKRFKYTRAPDELFFQTILMGFDYQHKNEIKFDHLRYFDWQTGPTYPRILTKADYRKFMDSGQLFARKFDEEIDSEVIDSVLSQREQVST